MIFALLGVARVSALVHRREKTAIRYTSFLTPIRDKFDPFANVSIQTTQSSVCNQDGMSTSLRSRTEIITVICQNTKEPYGSYISNEQKNGTSGSDPLFLAETVPLKR